MAARLSSSSSSLSSAPKRLAGARREEEAALLAAAALALFAGGGLARVVASPISRRPSSLSANLPTSKGSQRLRASSTVKGRPLIQSRSRFLSSAVLGMRCHAVEGTIVK